MAHDPAVRPAVPAHEAIRAALGKILQSRAFARSERQRRFLRHTVEVTLGGGSDALKEPTLGVEIFDRGPDFDARSDNIVRVEARRLRQRLQDYYKAEGSADAVLIELPTGGYVPQFSWRDIPEVPPPVRRSPAVLRRGAAAALALAAVATAAFLWSKGREAPLVAVLPFADYSGGEAGPYRGDGVAEDILQLLAETPRLRVVARTSSFRFRGQNADVGEIRRKLGAEALLEGSLRQDGERIRIAARLVDGNTGVPLWAETRETDAAGLDRAERSIAAAVTAALKAGTPRPAPSHVPPPEAQDLLARARYLAGRPGPENRLRSVEHYERAVALDPKYARAWGELSRLLSLIAFHDSVAPESAALRIKETAANALRLDPSLADPHFALARLSWFHDWDWKAAEGGWKRTLELNPNYAAAHQAYALGLVTRRRFREAEHHSRRAAELDPLAFAASNDLGIVLYAARRFDEAAAHARVTMSLAPDSPAPHFLMGVVDTARTRYGNAIAELETAASSLSRTPEVLGRLGNAAARSGRTAEARALLAEMERDPEAGRIYLAMVETGLGNRDRALELLAASAARRESDVPFIAADPVFDPLRGDRRFAALCFRLGLPAE